MGTEKIDVSIKKEDIAGFKNSIKAISGLCVEVDLDFKQEGLEIISMDPANVAMVVFKMPSTKFVKYDVSSDRVGIKVDLLRDILRRAGNDDEYLSIKVTENKVKLEMKGKVLKQYSLPIIELENKPQKMPSLDFSAKAEIKVSDFESALADIGIMKSESVFFEQTEKKKGITFSEKDELNSVVTEVTEGSFSGEGKCKYSLEYLNKMILKAEKVVIEFKKDYPMKLSYGDICFILAPRIDNCDE